MKKILPPVPEPPSSPPSSIAVSSAARIPVKTLLALALVPTMIAFRIGLPDEPSLWLALIVQSVMTVLPTLIIYFFLLLGLYLAVTRRTATSSLVLGLALLPFVDWGYEQWATARAQEQEAREVAALPTTPVAHVPATLVWESSGVTGLNGVWTVPGIQHVITKDTFSSRLEGIERPPDITSIPWTRPTPVASLPDEYLLLKIGPDSSFAKKYATYSRGPFELRYQAPGHDDLVAVWYRAFNPRPSAMPLLTLLGWFRGANTVTFEETAASIGAFLASALPSSG